MLNATILHIISSLDDFVQSNFVNVGVHIFTNHESCSKAFADCSKIRIFPLQARVFRTFEIVFLTLFSVFSTLFLVIEPHL